jgi:hypothetical protein
MMVEGKKNPTSARIYKNVWVRTRDYTCKICSMSEMQKVHDICAGRKLVWWCGYGSKI